MIGAHKNCASENANINHPPKSAATSSVHPVMLERSFGITGMMIPKPVTSISNVMKINPSAGARDVVWDTGRGSLAHFPRS